MFKQLNLNPSLLKALQDKNFVEPTAIQSAAIPKILNHINIIGRAPTGTGKTLAYLLPILQSIEPNVGNIQAVVIAPTYELAMQTARTANDFAKPFGIRVQGLIGGANINRQIDALKKKPHIIVGSTGRILELERKKKLKLNAVRFFVLDEFDRLLDDQNFKSTVELKNILPPNVECFMFSATAPKKALNRSKEIGTFELVTVDIDQNFAAKRNDFFAVVEFRAKIDKVRRLTNRLEIKRGLVFVNKNFDVERAVDKLRFEGIRAESLVGSAGKVDRKNAINSFINGKAQLLLSTDLAARGLDIPNVDYVINLDLPDDAKMYLHRAGRTARAGAEGNVITLVDPKELDRLYEFERILNIKFTQIDLKTQR
ncbi:MAG: DEAD/DEAH box helicase [Selenomonadaceae bacterium]|nr:DEAD/DEAH box helicase [Selenomonadaceae bacterium]